MKKMSAHKAYAAAITTFVALLMAKWGLGEPPSPEQIELALTDVATALAAGLASWLATYFKANKEKSK